jgi:hypothetical protein
MIASRFHLLLFLLQRRDWPYVKLMTERHDRLTMSCKACKVESVLNDRLSLTKPMLTYIDHHCSAPASFELCFMHKIRGHPAARISALGFGTSFTAFACVSLMHTISASVGIAVPLLIISFLALLLRVHAIWKQRGKRRGEN